MRAATAAAEMKHAWNAKLRNTRSRPRPSWARITLKSGRSPTFSRTSATMNSDAEITCATTFAIAEPSRPRSAP